MHSKILFLAIRHGLTAVGGVLVGAGYLSNGDVEVAVGAIMTLVGVAMSVYDKRQAAV
jgi:hypothetical protein